MTIGELGEIKRVFKPGLANLMAGIIIAILLMVAGCGLVYLPVNGVMESGGDLPVWTAQGQKGWSWGAAGLLGTMGIGLAIGSFFLIRWVRSLFSFQVHLGENGCAVIEKQGVRLFSWDDIVSVQETHLYERPPVLKGVAKFALPKMRSKSFVVRLKEREPFAFDGNTIKGHSKLAQMIRQETDARNIPWEIEEVHGY